MKRSALAALALAAGLLVVPIQAAEAGTASCHPALSSLTLSAASVPGGASVKATVRLTCAAPAAVRVQVKGFKGVTAPTVIEVAKRHSSATATIRTGVTRATRHGDIEAILRRARRSDRLTVTRTPRACKTPKLTSVSAPALTYVGNTVRLAIGLSCAPTATIRLSLASNNAELPVPARVAVGRYYDYAVVALAPKADEAGQYRATVTVRYGGKAISRAITVDPGLSVFAIPPCSEPDCVAPDVLFTGNIPAGGYTVHLSSNNSAIAVPATQTFQAGSLGGGFIVRVSPVTKNTTVTLSATFGGRTLHTSTTLLPPWTNKDSLTLSAEAGSGPIYGQEFSLEYLALLSNPAPPGGETVTFSSPSSSVEISSPTWDISPGDDDAYVDINTADVTSPVHTDLVATVDGVTATLPLVIEPGLDSFTDVPATVTGGDPFSATLNLAGPVDANTTVALQSTDGVVSVPVTVVVPAGQSSVNFMATTVPVTADDQVTIYAYLGNGNINSATVTVTP